MSQYYYRAVDDGQCCEQYKCTIQEHASWDETPNCKKRLEEEMQLRVKRKKHIFPSFVCKLVILNIQGVIYIRQQLPELLFQLLLIS